MSSGVVYTAEGETVAVALDDAQMPFERVKLSKIHQQTTRAKFLHSLVAILCGKLVKWHR